MADAQNPYVDEQLTTLNTYLVTIKDALNGMLEDLGESEE